MRHQSYRLPWIGLAHYVFDRQFHGGLPAQEFQQYLHPSLRRKHFRDEAAKILKLRRSQPHRLANVRQSRDHVQLRFTQGGFQIGNHLVTHRRPFIAEVDHSHDTRQVQNMAKGLLQVKPGKSVAGKKGFGKPNWATASQPPKSNAWKEHFNPSFSPKMSRGNVLAFGSCPDAKPAQDLNIIDPILGFFNDHATPITQIRSRRKNNFRQNPKKMEPPG